MILIADSGSTKTAWCLVPEQKPCNSTGNKEKNEALHDGNIYMDTHNIYIYTQGINPFQQTEEDICSVLSHELMPTIIAQAGNDVSISSIFFYGAGCTHEKSPIVASALRRIVSADARISVESDMLGAARGLCGKDAGIVCILGTGSNSCYYDGDGIIANVSPLGYILGDEGSGAYIGKRLVGDVLKHQLPEDVCKLFLEETHETQASIIQKVYREMLPNRFLASLSTFCARHRELPSVHALLIDCFMQFFTRNIDNYRNIGETNCNTVHFIGSIAHYYRSELSEAAQMSGYKVGNILQAPLEGLVRYHNI